MVWAVAIAVAIFVVFFAVVVVALAVAVAAIIIVAVAYTLLATIADGCTFRRISINCGSSHASAAQIALICFYTLYLISWFLSFPFVLQQFYGLIDISQKFDWQA